MKGSEKVVFFIPGLYKHIPMSGSSNLWVHLAKLGKIWDNVGISNSFGQCAIGLFGAFVTIKDNLTQYLRSKDDWK